MENELEDSENCDSILEDVDFQNDNNSVMDVESVGEQSSLLCAQGSECDGDETNENISVTECDDATTTEDMQVNTLQTPHPPPAYRPRKPVDFDEEEDDNKPALSPELVQGFKILRSLMSDSNKSINWPFKDPVDTEGLGLYDYHERIKHPMWLRKMKEKFDNREYDSITQFVADFRLMLENCYRYNGPDHAISKKAQRLETVMEQKLTLLSRELREKTSIEATSGRVIEEKASLCAGRRRLKTLVPHDSTALLNQLRHEEVLKERDMRRQQMEDKKKQQEEFVQSLQSWEDGFLGPIKEQINASWELPQIGHFLFLCGDMLNVGEVVQWELERCFLAARESSTMQTVMTSLLSTPYQRTRLDRKPAMPYKVWEEKVRVRVRQWYKTFHENGKDTKKISQKLGLDERFFKIVGMKNPLEKKKYHELSFYQKVWLMKGLCDWCLETQESIREAIETQPLLDQRDYLLGYDGAGNTYLHFPQFCGADLRIYRQAPIVMPKFERPKPEVEEVQTKKYLGTPKKYEAAQKKKKKESSKSARTPAPGLASTPRPSRLRQNPKQVLQYNVDTLTSSTSSSSEDENDQSLDNDDSGVESDSDVKSGPRLGQGDQLAPKHHSDRSTRSRSGTPSPSTSRARRGIRQRKTRTSLRRQVLEAGLDDTDNVSEAATEVSCKSDRTDDTDLSCVSSRLTEKDDTLSLADSESVTSSSFKPDNESSQNNVEKKNCTPRRTTTRRGKGKRRGKRSQYKAAGSSADKDSSVCDRLDDLDAQSEVTESASVVSMEQDERHTQDCASVLSSTLSAEQPDDKDVLADTSRSVTPNPPPDVSSHLSADTDSQDMTNNTHPPPLPDDKQGLTDTDTNSINPSDSNCAESSLMNGEEGHRLTDDDHHHGSHREGAELKPLGHVTDLDKAGETESAPPLVNGDVSKQDSLVSDSGEHDYSRKTSLNNDPSAIPGNTDQESKTGAINATECDSSKSNADQPGIKQERESSVAADQSTVKQESENIVTGDQSTVKQERENTADTEMCKSDDTKTDLTSVDSINGIKSSDDQNEKVKSEIKSEENSIDIKQEAPGEYAVPSEDEEPEITAPEAGSFELVATSVESLRHLVARFAEPEPIIENKGKKQKVFKPPPRKRCEADLYKRLCYLLNELEPWESKLIQAHRRARMKVRKEVEEYVEEPEPTPEEVEKVWESEESVSESSDDSDDDDDDNEENGNNAEADAKKTDPKQAAANAAAKKNKRKKPVESSAETAAKVAKQLQEEEEEEFEPDVSSFGRLRKRRVIPNNIEDQGVKRKKVVKTSQAVTADSTPSVKPAILSHSRSTSQAQSVSNPNAATHTILLSQNKGAKPTILITPQNMNLISQVRSLQGGSIQTIQATPELIQALMSSRKVIQATSSTAATSTQGQIKLAQASSTTIAATSPQQQFVTIATQNVSAAASSGAVTMTTSSKTLLPNALSPEKPQYVSYDKLASLPPSVIQALLKTQAIRMRMTAPQNPATAAASRPVLHTPTNIPILRKVTPNVPVGTRQTLVNVPSVMLRNSKPASNAATVLSPTKINFVQNANIQTVVSSVSPVKSAESLTSSAAGANQLSSVVAANPGIFKAINSPPKPKYAGNVTVKDLLEQNKAASQRSDSTEQNPPLSAICAVETVTLPLSVMSQNFISTSITTNVSSTSTMLLPLDGTAGVQRPVTSTSQAIKLPIPALPTVHTPAQKPSVPASQRPDSALGSSTGAMVGSSQAAASQLSHTQTGAKVNLMLTPTSAISATTAQTVPSVTAKDVKTVILPQNCPTSGAKNRMVLRVVPQQLMTAQGVVQGMVLPAGMVLPQEGVVVPQHLVQHQPIQVKGQNLLQNIQLLQTPSGQLIQGPTGQLIQTPTGQLLQSPTGQLIQSPSGQVLQGTAGQIQIQNPSGQLIQNAGVGGNVLVTNLPVQKGGLQLIRHVNPAAASSSTTTLTATPSPQTGNKPQSSVPSQQVVTTLTQNTQPVTTQMTESGVHKSAQKVPNVPTVPAAQVAQSSPGLNVLQTVTNASSLPTSSQNIQHFSTSAQLLSSVKMLLASNANSQTQVSTVQSVNGKAVLTANPQKSEAVSLAPQTHKAFVVSSQTAAVTPNITTQKSHVSLTPQQLAMISNLQQGAALPQKQQQQTVNVFSPQQLAQLQQIALQQKQTVKAAPTQNLVSHSPQANHQQSLPVNTSSGQPQMYIASQQQQANAQIKPQINTLTAQQQATPKLNLSQANIHQIQQQSAQLLSPVKLTSPVSTPLSSLAVDANNSRLLTGLKIATSPAEKTAAMQHSTVSVAICAATGSSTQSSAVNSNTRATAASGAQMLLSGGRMVTINQSPSPKVTSGQSTVQLTPEQKLQIQQLIEGKVKLQQQLLNSQQQRLISKQQQAAQQQLQVSQQQNASNQQLLVSTQVCQQQLLSSQQQQQQSVNNQQHLLAGEQRQQNGQQQLLIGQQQTAQQQPLIASQQQSSQQQLITGQQHQNSHQQQTSQQFITSQQQTSQQQTSQQQFITSHHQTSLQQTNQQQQISQQQQTSQQHQQQSGQQQTNQLLVTGQQLVPGQQHKLQLQVRQQQLTSQQLIDLQQQLKLQQIKQQLLASQQPVSTCQQPVQTSQQQVHAIEKQLLASTQLQTGKQQILANKQQVLTNQQQVLTGQQQVLTSQQQVLNSQQLQTSQHQQLLNHVKQQQQLVNIKNIPVGASASVVPALSVAQSGIQNTNNTQNVSNISSSTFAKSPQRTVVSFSQQNTTPVLSMSTQQPFAMKPAQTVQSSGTQQTQGIQVTGHLGQNPAQQLVQFAANTRNLQTQTLQGSAVTASSQQNATVHVQAFQNRGAVQQPQAAVQVQKATLSLQSGALPTQPVQRLVTSKQNASMQIQVAQNPGASVNSVPICTTLTQNPGLSHMSHRFVLSSPQKTLAVPATTVTSHSTHSVQNSSVNPVTNAASSALSPPVAASQRIMLVSVNGQLMSIPESVLKTWSGSGAGTMSTPSVVTTTLSMQCPSDSASKLSTAQQHYAKPGVHSSVSTAISSVNVPTQSLSQVATGLSNQAGVVTPSVIGQKQAISPQITPAVMQRLIEQQMASASKSPLKTTVLLKPHVGAAATQQQTGKTVVLGSAQGLGQGHSGQIHIHHSNTNNETPNSSSVVDASGQGLSNGQ